MWWPQGREMDTPGRVCGGRPQWFPRGRRGRPRWRDGWAAGGTKATGATRGALHAGRHLGRDPWPLPTEPGVSLLHFSQMSRIRDGKRISPACQVQRCVQSWHCDNEELPGQQQITKTRHVTIKMAFKDFLTLPLAPRIRTGGACGCSVYPEITRGSQPSATCATKALAFSAVSASLWCIIVLSIPFSS